MSLDPALFRRVLGSFASGVTVLTTRGADGALHGMTASAFTSLSMDPPLVLACVAKKARLHGLLAVGAPMSVSMLGEAQAPLSNHFAGYAPDVVPTWAPTPAGVDRLDGAVAWLAGPVHALHEGGDHTIVVLRVEAAAWEDAPPLAYFRGKYGRFVPA